MGGCPLDLISTSRPTSDFGDAYWRSAAYASAKLPQAVSYPLQDLEFRLLAEHLPTLCTIAGADGNVIWFNRRWYEFVGATAADMAGDGWQRVHDPEDLPHVVQTWQQAVASGQPFELTVRLRGADGRFRPFLTRVWPLLDDKGKPVRWFGVATDIGAQLAAEAALRAESDSHAALIAAQQEVAAATDLDAMLQAVVTGAMAMSPHVEGASVELVEGDKLACRATAGLASRRQGQRLPMNNTLASLCVREGRPCITGDALNDPRTNTERAQKIGARSLVAVPVFRRDEAAGVLKLMSSRHNAFTERDIAVAQLLAGALAAGFADVAEAEAASALHESEARFQVLTDAVDPMIWSASPDGRTDFYNARWYDFVGVEKTPNHGDLWMAVLHPDDWMRAATSWNHSVASGEPFEIEYRLRHHSGQYRWALGRATLLRDAAGAKLRWYGTCTDIHDRRVAESALRDLNDTLEQRVAQEVAERAKAEAALRQSQKMEAVGQLTGGIAHDFNNLLTIITGNIDTALRALSAPTPDAPAPEAKARRALESAMNGAERAAALTKRLLAFARRQPLAPRAVDVGRLLAGMEDMLNHALGETVQLKVTAAENLWQVEADPNQLESAILNLAVNARDAMQAGGRVLITTTNETMDVAFAAGHNGLVPGDYVVTTVTDTGHGMKGEVAARAFEPFFTTKEVGRGTGLGLSQVYGFVKQSGGYVMLQSQPGQGTTVRICLPRLRGARAEADALPQTAPPPAGAQETILVVEDDNDVRCYTVECVRDLGYRVIEAADGESALRLLAQNPQVDLLFTDVVMPGLSGTDLVVAARTARPTLKILYTSGYTRDTIMHGTGFEPGVDMIGKPFTYSALAAKLRGLLEE